MKYDKSTVIGVAVCVILLLMWSPIMRFMGWSSQTPRQSEPTEEQAAGETDPPPQRASRETPPVLEQESQSDQPVEAPDAVAFEPPEETMELVLPDVFSAVINARTGGIVSVELLQYKTDDRKHNVVLGRPRYPLAAVVPSSLGSELIQPQLTQPDNRTIVLRRSTADGGMLVAETWKVHPDEPYALTYSIGIRNSSDEPLDVDGLAISCGSLASSRSAERSGRLAGGREGAVDLMFMNEKRPKTLQVKDVKKLDPEEAAELVNRDVEWIAVHSKYFLYFAAATDASFTGCTVGMEKAENLGDKGAYLRSAAILRPTQVPPGKQVTWNLTCYAGPKEYARLQQLGRNAESIMRLDLFLFWHPAWMGFISKLILTSLTGLNDFFNHSWGYGFAIIIVTMVVKTLFWPLTHRSTVSMRKMQKIQPEIQALREKYKDQPEKMNRKMMELYKEYKVNPLGGCLPILFQIPVFFALFNTLRGAIELRHAGFLWVQDLSMPDTLAFSPEWLPIRPLAILMALSMLAQQKMMPSSANPQQSRMMMFMSVFFLFIFYSMPAGLTLYWTVNQILTIGQNLVTKRLDNDDTAAKAPQPAKT